MIGSLTRKDAGPYELRVKNIAGSQNATITVVVMDKPSAPAGPVKISDITAESVMVSWSPPEEDGGTPITHYTLDKLDINIGWTEVSSFVVRTSQKVTRLNTGQEYIFRVRAVNKFGVSDPLESEPVLVCHPFNVPSAPGQPEAILVTKDSVSLKWGEPATDGGSAILGYVHYCI